MDLRQRFGKDGLKNLVEIEIHWKQTTTLKNSMPLERRLAARTGEPP
jgi:hypothetical protein